MSGAEDAGRRAEDVALPGGDFRLFVQKLGYQALIALGAMENPLTGQRSSNPVQAQGVLDDLRMLRDRTRGNLSEEEEHHLTAVIQQLQLQLTGAPEGDVPGSEDEGS